MNNLSICIPTYKRLDYLKAFVETVPERYQIYISDNGSFIPDNFFKRSNIKIKHIKDVIPMFSNWNSAIDMVETDWFIIPGDDDVVNIDKLPQIEEYINEYNDCAYLAFAYDIIDENNNVTGGWKPGFTKRFEKVDGFKYIQRGVPFRWPSIVINKSRSEAVGNIDESFNFTAGDSLYLQTMAVKYPIVVINEKVGKYRIWESGYTNIRIFTKDWFEKIEMWQQKLNKLIMSENIDIDLKKLHDQAMCDNIISAIRFNKQTTIRERVQFVFRVGWPFKSGIKDQLSLLKAIIS